MVSSANLASYDFSIAEVMKAGWQKTKGFKLIFWGAFLTYFFVSFGIVFIFSLVTALINPDPLVQALSSIVFAFIFYPMIVGLYILGVKRASDQPVSIRMIFSYYPAIFRLDMTWLLGAFICLLLSGFGNYLINFAYSLSPALKFLSLGIGVLFIIFPVYLVIGYFYATVVSALKKTNPWRSLELSRRQVSQHWFKTFLLLLFTIILIGLSAIPFGIGLIWTLPWSYTTFGVLYRKMFPVD